VLVRTESLRIASLPTNISLTREATVECIGTACSGDYPGYALDQRSRSGKESSLCYAAYWDKVGLITEPLSKRNEWSKVSDMPHASKVYESRIVAFVDILGWSQESQVESAKLLIANKHLHDAAENYSKRIKSAIQNIPNSEPNPTYMKIHVGAFSDSLVVSMPDSFGYMIFGLLSSVCSGILRSGFLTRGAVTIGSLYHAENAVFGPALVEAVGLEREAVYPRIICSPKLLNHLESCQQIEDESIVVDHLGRHISNLFLYGSAPNANQRKRSFADQMWGIPNILKTIEGEIQKFSSNSNDKITEKWRYMYDIIPMMLRRFED
jgi:hypothetical protein